MTIDGVQVLAQVIPVLMLVVAVERRGLPRVKFPRRGSIGGRSWWWFRAGFLLLVMVASAVAEVCALYSVAYGWRPNVYISNFIWCTLVGLVLLSTTIAIDLALTAFIKGNKN